jgi:Lactonase, 7-bladed beta-propeller
VVFSLPIGEHGTLSAPASSVQDTGSRPNARQTGPHPHCIVTDPTGRSVLVADFGADRVFIYPFDRRTRVISTAGAPAPYAVSPGYEAVNRRPQGASLSGLGGARTRGCEEWSADRGPSGCGIAT